MVCHRLAAALAIFIVVASPGRAWAQRSADTLRVVWQQSLTRLDPYRDPSLGTFVLAHEVFDTLVYRNPKTFAIEPLLATSWKWLDDRTLVFTLRNGVKWQNGTPFTASDVAGTINMIATDPMLARSPLYGWIAGADEVDPAHVRLRLSRVMPAALDYLAMDVWILPEALRQKMGADAFAAAPVGTGPYRVAGFDGLGGVVLERFDGYFSGSPKGRPAITHIRFRPAPDQTSELAALIAGNADWIWHFDASYLAAVQRDPRLVGVVGGSLRITYLSLDAAGRSGAGNPMTDVRVREAIAAAIDRSSLALAFGGPAAHALIAPCAPPQFGCEREAAVPIAYNPDRARKLLHEAGFSEGFSLQITTYEPPDWAAAVRSYLRDVGISAEIIRLPRGEVILRDAEGENRAELGDWPSDAISDVSAILPHFFSFGDDDYTRDPRLRDLIAAGGSTRDPARRLSDYAQAIHIITANVDWLPLWTVTIPYAFSKDLDFTPDPDGLPRFYLTRWQNEGTTTASGSGD